MSEPLKPWDVGYVAKESVAMPKKVSGQLGGLAFAARKAAGLPDKPKKGDGTGKRGRKRTSEAAEIEAQNTTEETISLAQKTFLDKFIYEYLYDFSSPMAFIRAGGKPGSATTSGPKALRTAYVQNQLRMLSNQLQEEQIITRNEVLIGIKKEAHHYGVDGSSAARVRAWGMLAKVLGMDQPPPPVDPNEGKPLGGVMEIPAAVTDVEWSDMATQSQSALKLDVRK